MLYSGKSKANGLLFKWKSLLQNEFWNTQSFAMYRPSSNESSNKTSYLFASVSLLNINISGVARILSDSTWLPPQTLYSACRVQETLFLKDFSRKCSLFALLTSPVQEQSLQMTSDTSFDANRDTGYDKHVCGNCWNSADLWLGRRKWNSFRTKLKSFLTKKPQLLASLNFAELWLQS